MSSNQISRPADWFEVSETVAHCRIPRDITHDSMFGDDGA
jgi:hypothetical protein